MDYNEDMLAPTLDELNELDYLYEEPLYGNDFSSRDFCSVDKNCQEAP